MPRVPPANRWSSPRWAAQRRARAPAVTERELGRYLDCGIPVHGCARARCADCGHDFLIAYSCKCRGVCPSCTTRRMVETAAHLADHVIACLPPRQWVLAVPKRLRLSPGTRSGSSQRRTAHFPDRHRAGAAPTQSRRQCGIPPRRRGLYPPLWGAAQHPSALPLRGGGWRVRGRCDRGGRFFTRPAHWMCPRSETFRPRCADDCRARSYGAACCRRSTRR